MASLREVFDEVRTPPTPVPLCQGSMGKMLSLVAQSGLLLRVSGVGLNKALNMCRSWHVKPWLWLQVARFINSRTDPLLV